MNKQLFYLLILVVFGFVISACQSTRQTDVSINPANAANQTTDKPEAGQAASDISTKNENTEKPVVADVRKNMKKDSDGKFENRCGWFENPTPGNAWLTDKDGEWLIGAQGGYQAEGDWAEFSDDQWVKTNINYGYGCACMQVTVDRKNMKILKISSATAKPLSACRNDKALEEPIE